MELEKSLFDRLHTVYPKAFDLLYEKDGDAKEFTGLTPKTEDLLWSFVDGIGSYIDGVLSHRIYVAIDPVPGPVMAIIEDRILAVEKITGA